MSESRSEDALNALNNELEDRVEQRTAELKQEIAQRKAAEDSIRASLNEKVILLREIHHRVKNNLPIIISLLNMQSRQIPDEIARISFGESRNRIRAMALVHEKLYQSANLSTIDLDNYVRFLANGLQEFYGVEGNRITKPYISGMFSPALIRPFRSGWSSTNLFQTP